MGAVALTPVRLGDGSEVELHLMSPGDAADLVRFHGGLSPDTVYLRFFSVHPRLSDPELDHLTHVDHHRREAIVATVDGDIVGVARFDQIPGTDDAEAAFVVTDRWQGRGLGSALMQRLAERAREEGMRRLVAEVLPHNRRMLGVFLHAGLPATTGFRDGVVHVAVELEP